MPEKPSLPIDRQYGPKDAQLAFRDRNSSGAEPNEEAGGIATPGTGGTKAVLTEPAPGGAPDAVDDTKFLASQFDIHPHKAAELATAQRQHEDADVIAQIAADEIRQERAATVEGMPDEPRRATGLADPFGKKPANKDPQTRNGAG